MKMRQFDIVEAGCLEQGILVLKQGTQVLRISLYGDSQLRLSYHGEGQCAAIDNPETGLPPVLLKGCEPHAGEWSTSEQGWDLKTTRFHLKIQADPFKLEIFNHREELALAQSGPLAYSQHGTRLTATWQWDGQPLVGLGDKSGPLDKRGRHFALWNTDVVPHLPSTDPLYKSIPWLLSKSWGMFVNNSFRSEWDLAKKNSSQLEIQVDGGILDQWIFLGENPEEILRQWMEWVGKMPLPPLWSLGHHQSRYSYHPQEQVLDMAKTMRAKHIPCDVFHLDIHYMDGFRDFTWDTQEFSDPDGMIKQMHEMHYRVVTIVDPGVKKDEGYPVCVDGLAKGCFCTKGTGEVYVGDVWPGPSVFPDFSRSSVREWWGEQQAKLLASGIDGIWNDMNEPAVFNVPGKTFPPDVCHGEEGELSHAEIHNRYGSLMAQAAYEGLLKFTPDKRPYVLTRAGFAGVQRFSSVWLGDNSSWWEHLTQAVAMCMNTGLSGIAFVGTDIGGFCDDSEGELLVRWAQLGAFTPFCRNHAAVDTIQQEPWAFGEEVEEVYRQAMELRYRLLPMLYTLFEESSRSGLPVMRALLLEFPEDATAWRVNDQFMFGKDCLVTPVIQKGARERLVYLPEGIWQNRVTGQIHEGKRFVIAEAPLAEIPMFVRAGGMMGFGKGGEFTHSDLLDVSVLEVYAHAPFERETNFYADAGDGFAYQTGEYRRLTISGGFDGTTLKLKAHQAGEYEHQATILVEVHWGDGPVTRHQWKLADEFTCTS